MLRSVQQRDPSESAREAGRALRTILDWLGRTRTRTFCVDVRIFGREILRIEMDRGRC